MSAGEPERWSTEPTADGSLTARSPVHGEACHSRAGAWSEARARYVRSCRLPGRLAASGPTLRVLEIGTGLGWNLAATLEAAAHAGARVALTTLELDAGVIRRALALGPAALAGRTDARPWMEATLASLGRGLLESATRPGGRPVRWGEWGELTLVLGDARRTLPEHTAPGGFDAIYLDAFSPGVEPELWEPGFLSELAARLAPGGLLSTYSAATRVRAALRAAGLVVGPGPRFGAKAEGTLASPDLALEPFPARVERRIARRAEALAAIRRESGPGSGLD